MNSGDAFKAFHAGEDEHAYRLLGALPEGNGFRFTVWAPEADTVSVIGDFNLWDDQAHRLERITDLGVWSAVVPGARAGQRYKYRLRSRNMGADHREGRPVWPRDGGAAPDRLGARRFNARARAHLG